MSMHLTRDCKMSPPLDMSPAKRPVCYLAHHHRGPLGWEPRKCLIVRAWSAVWIANCHISHPIKSSSQGTVTHATASLSTQHEKQMCSSCGIRINILSFLYLLTYSMVRSPSWEANWFAASQEIPRIFIEPEGSLPHSQSSATCPSPGPAQSSPHTHIPPPGDPS